MRFPRITTRRLMAGIAAVGLALATYLYVREKLDAAALGYEALANEHAIRMGQLDISWPYQTPSERARTEAKIARHQALVDKYLHAARHPWLPVPPGPTPPE